MSEWEVWAHQNYYAMHGFYGAAAAAGALGGVPQNNLSQLPLGNSHINNPFSGIQPQLSTPPNLLKNQARPMQLHMPGSGMYAAGAPGLPQRLSPRLMSSLQSPGMHVNPMAAMFSQITAGVQGQSELSPTRTQQQYLPHLPYYIMPNQMYASSMPMYDGTKTAENANKLLGRWSPGNNSDGKTISTTIDDSPVSMDSPTTPTHLPPLPVATGQARLHLPTTITCNFGQTLPSFTNWPREVNVTSDSRSLYSKDNELLTIT